MKHNIPLIIPAAGRGSRSFPQSEWLPKTLFRFNGRCLLDYVFDIAEMMAISEVFVIVGYKAEMITAYLGEEYRGMSIRYVYQSELKGLVHAIGTLKPYLDRPFVMLLGDEVYRNTQHQNLLPFFQKHNPDGVCGLIRTPHPKFIKKNYSVEIENARIVKLDEKPEVIVNDWMGTGTCVFNPDVFQYIERTPVNPKRKEKELVDLIQVMTDDGKIFVPFDLEGECVNVNSLGDLDLLQRDVVEKPKEIQIEPTIRCVNDCIMCNREARMRGARDMRLEEFKYIVDQFNSLEKIRMHGIGEPLLNNAFIDMLVYVNAKGINACFNTSLPVLNPELARAFIDLQVEEVRISLDAADRETYQRIRCFDRFNDVVRNIEKLMLLRDQSNSMLPYIKIVVVATKYNLDSLADIVELACRLKVDEVLVQNLQSWSSPEFRETTKKDHSIFFEDLVRREAAFMRAEIVAHTSGIKLSLPQLKNKKYTCSWPWTSCYVSVEGFVTPCCNCSDPRTKNMGNIFRQSIDQIWNSPEYNQFRHGIKGGKLPEVCEECIILSGDFKNYGDGLIESPRGKPLVRSVRLAKI